VIGDDEMDELPGRDIDGIAGRMRPMPRDIEVVEREGEVHRVPIVEPMRPGECEQRGKTDEQQVRGQRVRRRK